MARRPSTADSGLMNERSEAVDFDLDLGLFLSDEAFSDVFPRDPPSHYGAGDGRQSEEGHMSASSSVSGGVPLSDVVDETIYSKPLRESSPNATTDRTKVGSRFTSANIRTLKIWFENHERHPYPTPEQVERLLKQTGLSKRQLTNWFANTRRRRKVRPSGSSTPIGTESGSNPMDIPVRRPTPMAFEQMNPMQRWEHSPPQSEPALVADISRAVAASSRLSGLPARSRSSAGSWENASTISSVGTSQSSGGSRSNLSAYSRSSSKPPSPLETLRRDSTRRRRRAMVRVHSGNRLSLRQTNTYQCTFCAETFKTRYDWQRHEKSLHLSLEEWICSPHGSTTTHPEKGVICVYCEEVNPSQQHLDAHHQAACSERSVEERTYYRKDHLRQHLKLVHKTSQMSRTAESWKVTTDNVRSRCGFCGISLESWATRGDHIGDHYRDDGNTMSDWKGNWGFETHILAKVDNAVPPCVIQFEQSAPVPFCASVSPAGSAPSAYELLKLEVEYFVRNYFEAHESLPSDDQLIYEACTIIYASEFLQHNGTATAASWLRDLLMSSTELSEKARLRPMNQCYQLAKLSASQLLIIGKTDIFEDCELEAQLCRHLGDHLVLGLSPSDDDLQQEACVILNRVESASTNPSRRFTGFLVRLMWKSTSWLAPLRQRAEYFASGSYQELIPYPDPTTNMTSGQLNDFFTGLAELNQLTGAAEKLIPTTATAITRKMQSAIPAGTVDTQASSSYCNSEGHQDCISPGFSFDAMPMKSGDFYTRLQTAKTMFEGSGHSLRESGGSKGTGMPFFLNDPNRYARLAGELSRFVASTISPRNPNMHIPSDDELRYHARWVIFEDDDPWNQTAADIPEWLADFKKGVGLE
ncbi:hypothetical protein CORC01_07184 [Colletotrichum orchidophilum]|uniref:Homeobox and C2H2 transcription factor n=1 Tax=Colletotrichum orchidophilum TaxID=1209926 RepID=A0A1G4B7Z6_9PEZI|nr:uncharacterized protein CORC01_07184 [Colletotrichum orchidophilum]OHE97569.1 hypothetical protein CORC01_07184 [Colletotrichum orchidophilum]